jgi:hypothetical protein
MEGRKKEGRKKKEGWAGSYNLADGHTRKS